MIFQLFYPNLSFQRCRQECCTHLKKTWKFGGSRWSNTKEAVAIRYGNSSKRKWPLTEVPIHWTLGTVHNFTFSPSFRSFSDSKTSWYLISSTPNSTRRRSCDLWMCSGFHLIRNSIISEFQFLGGFWSVPGEVLKFSELSEKLKFFEIPRKNQIVFCGLSETLGCSKNIKKIFLKLLRNSKTF